jgi:sulfur carrier protein
MLQFRLLFASPSTVIAMISVHINGQLETLNAPLSVADLLQSKGLAGKRLAVERNGQIVPRGVHADTALADGDTLEIVVAVGGG